MALREVVRRGGRAGTKSSRLPGRPCFRRRCPAGPPGSVGQVRRRTGDV